ncbi:MAG: bifunctional glutamate N-acetyltransferase/amino-acid acetyltransferase ArgJ [Chitinispirillaceae bacterium]|nr:bifunctional glutamate N-acetyltransferase/amino-acid acetyltransferase ArgJ [Chitinispirillaceae bacterium]
MGGHICVIGGGVTAAAGFSAGGIRAGIKQSGDPDLALLFSERRCTGAGVFTINKIRASSVDWSRSHLPSRAIRAIVCNSGCANACTGRRGAKDTAATARLAASSLGVAADTVLVASTGVIGRFLPLSTIAAAMPELKKRLSPSGGTAFVRAIMTTDRVTKESAVAVKIGRKGYTIGGCAKGAGMIRPNMATMLAFITTDAAIAPSRLNPIVKRVVDRTFNCLTVDGDTSTNDMLLVLANGASQCSVASKSSCLTFEEGLSAVCNELCTKIAADGEGATKRVEVHVKGGATDAEAKQAALAVADSNLTKCALFGNDPNWGRIACAVGYSGARFSDRTMTIHLCGIPVFKNLRPLPFDQTKAHNALKKKVVSIEINLGMGKASAVAHTCDFSYDYVKINAEYHT